MVLKGSSACVVYTSKKSASRRLDIQTKTAAITGCLIMRQFVAEPYSSLVCIKSTVISRCPQRLSETHVIDFSVVEMNHRLQMRFIASLWLKFVYV